MNDMFTINLGHILAAPSALHWLGCDELGRDVLARLLAATLVEERAKAYGLAILLADILQALLDPRLRRR